MPKRKAEGPPEFYEIWEATNSETSLVQGGSTTEQEVASDCPTGVECPQEPIDGHLAPVLPEVDEGPVSEYISFWALLSLAGYETW